MSVSFAYGKHAFYNIDSLVDVLMSVGMRLVTMIFNSFTSQLPRQIDGIISKSYV
jgi:hypothetical protein